MRISPPKQRLISLSLGNGSVEDERVRDINVATIGNLCVDMVLSVPKLPPKPFDELKVYMEELSKSPPDKVKGYAGEDQLGQALEGSDIVIIPVGVLRKLGMTCDDPFDINADIVKSLCEIIAKYYPDALVNVISNPVNSTVPVDVEVFKSKGVYDDRKLFGVTTLDVVRAKTFYAGKAKVDVADVKVPVIGGHAGVTILPLFSQATPKANMSEEDIRALAKRTQDGGTEVVEAKAGRGSATLSMT
ncbi:hypothetical protein ACS0TY_013149 [Phlomoides rotata]